MTSAAQTSPAAAALRGDAAVIGLVGLAHMASHFAQLLLPPLFPWLKDAMQASYTQLAFVMTVFFVVSCATQAASGFLVDRFGPRPVLLGGLALATLGGFGYALSPNYAALTACAALAGLGNGVFHPVDYTLLTRKVSPSRLGHGYSVHTITGSLGWALAPVVLVPLAIAFHWRLALAVAACVPLAALVVVWLQRGRLAVEPPRPAPAGARAADGSLAFLRIPAVWMCFGFFLFLAGVVTGVQAYAPEAARHLHGIPVALAAACVTAFMACSAVGTLAGGFLASDPARCERVVACAFTVAAACSLLGAGVHLAVPLVPVLFGVMGFAGGISAPSRDMLVKRSTPENASGRVFGVVYSGLDIGQSIAPLAYGALIDHGAYAGVWLVLALLQLLLVASALRVRRARRTLAVPA